METIVTLLLTPGTMGTAALACDVFRASHIYGDWPGPVLVIEVERKDVDTATELLAEKGIKVEVKSRRYR